MQNQIELQFTSERSFVRDGLSVVLQIEKQLFVASDETTSIESFITDDFKTYREVESFNISDFINLPAEDALEIDIEGITFENNYLWLTGSHSLKRKKIKFESEDIEKQINRLAKVEVDPNRYLIARIPFVKDEETGLFRLEKTAVVNNRKLTAEKIEGDDTSNMLMEELEDDKHIKNFLNIPGKDNGFDIEGLTISNNKLFLGLRGPVLRGWAIILTLEINDINEKEISFKKKNGKIYTKHFVFLHGMGIRELCVSNNDLLILAGPTMELDGNISVFKWVNGCKTKEASIAKPEKLFEVPFGIGKDKAEGMTIFKDDSQKEKILLVYDSPADSRKIGATSVLADLFEF